MKDIILGIHGRSRLAIKDLYLYSQRTAIQTHQAILPTEACTAARKYAIAMTSTPRVMENVNHHIYSSEIRRAEK